MDEDLDKAREQLNELLGKFPALSKELQEFAKNLKSSKDFKDAITQLNREIDKGRAGYKEQMRVVDSLTDSIEEAIDANEESAKIAKLLAQREQLIREAGWRNLKEQSLGLAKTFGSLSTTLAGSFTRDLQAGADATKLSTGVFSTAIDLGAATLTATASAFEGAGTAMAQSMNPLVAGFGAVTAGLSKLATKATVLASQFAKFALDVISKEVSKTVESFGKLSAGGVAMADGMMGMREAARGSMLTLEDFSNLVSRQSENIAQSGLGVNAGVKRMGQALTAGGDSMRYTLMNMGYSIEEQGDLVAETMKAMRQQAGPLTATGPEIALQTQKYAENLRIISAITGEDAKKKQAEAREAASQLAFQQKLAGMDESQRLGIVNAMANMSDVQRKNFMDMVNFGAVINRSGAVMNSSSQGMSEQLSRTMELFNAGALDAESFRAIQKQTNDQIRNDLQTGGAFVALAQAEAAGLTTFATDVANAAGKTLQGLPTEQAIKDAEKSVKSQKETTDEFTQNMNEAQIATKQLAIGLQDLLTGPMTKFAESTEGILTTMRDALIAMGFDMPGSAGGKPTETSVEAAGRSLTQEQDKLNEMDKRSFYEKARNIDPSEEVKAQQDIVKEKRKQYYDEQRLSKLKAQALATASAEYNKEYYGGAADWSFRTKQKLPEAVRQQAIEGAEAKFKWQNETKEGQANAQIEAMTGFARGGISRGPETGYASILHGIEAVVPLPDGKSIPISVKDERIANTIESASGMGGNKTAVDGTGSAMNRMVDVLQNQLNELRQQTSLTYDMVKSMERGNRTSKEILASSY